jgi:hypothetical protein
MWRCVCVLACALMLNSCAVQPTSDYALTPAEMKTAGSASLNGNENVPQLYQNAQYVQYKRK